jgi:hypothetical protein
MGNISRAVRLRRQRRRLSGESRWPHAAIAAGTGLVGCFKTPAQVFVRTGLRVTVSNWHADFFIKNLLAIRAEIRLALVVCRAACFGIVTGLN